MENTKHTPGPWKVFGGNNSTSCVNVLQKNGNDTFWTSVFTSNEREANAKLIAAAPDLLDKLIEVKGFLKRVQGPLTPANFLLQEIDELILKATE